MPRRALPNRRSAVVLGAGLLAGLALTGCGGATPTRTVPAAATESATPTDEPADEPSADDSPLADGLLPDTAFGEGAEVHRFPLDGLPFGDGDRGGPPWHDRDADADAEDPVAPGECGTALEQAASLVSGVQDAVGQVARADGVRTFEVLATADASMDVLAQVQTVVDACRSVTFDRGEDDDGYGPSSVSIEELDVPDGMAAFRVTISGERPDGTWDATKLVGVAQDGDRVLGLAQMSWDEELDPASFTALLQEAYDTQSEALD
ncbi:hypothetical protein ACI8AF_05470 [Blastococcus sp. SYSU D00669]